MGLKDTSQHGSPPNGTDRFAHRTTYASARNDGFNGDCTHAASTYVLTQLERESSFVTIPLSAIPAFDIFAQKINPSNFKQ